MQLDESATKNIEELLEFISNTSLEESIVVESWRIASCDVFGNVTNFITLSGLDFINLEVLILQLGVIVEWRI